jgi:two-component system sensor histidine kinase TctE
MSNKNISLRRKLIVWLVFPVLVLFAISAAGSYYAAYRFSYKAYDRALADSARDLTRQISIVQDRVYLELPAPARKMLLTDEYDKIYFKVSGPDGRLIDGNADLPPPGFIRNDEAPIMHDGRLYGQRLRIASRYYIPPGGKPGHPVLVQLAETLNKRRILAGEILSALVLPQLALIIAASLALWLGIVKGLRPMQRLRNEIAARSYHDLSPITEGYAPVEVQPIIHAVNELMSRLEKAILSQQRFIADAAHQLRTPIAGIKTQIDLASGQTDKEALQHSLQQLNISTGRIVRLINQMLNLAQVEPDANRVLDLKPVDLTETVQKATMEWVPVALRKEIDLGFDGPRADLVIKGDASRIKMLLDNLIDNAVRYSPPGSSITVRLEKSDAIVLSVEDNGPGIPVEERNHVFRRFYRILGSGTGHPAGGGHPYDTEGCGLGLSIVKEIADLHGAKIIIEDTGTRKGTLVKIGFPFLL